MKKFIIILLFFLSALRVNAHLYNNTNVKNTLLFESIFAIVSKDLDIDTCNLEIIISYSQFDESDNGYAAATRRISNNLYTISINKFTDCWIMSEVFIHELIHISQIQNNKLKIFRNSTWFEGKTYTNATPYDERLYEKEATNKAHDLYKKYKKELK